MAKAGHNSGDPYAVTGDELRQFVERYEQLESEADDIKEQMKEVMAEAKGRGYDTKILRMAIKRRKLSVDVLQEQESILQLYEDAIRGAFSGGDEDEL